MFIATLEESTVKTGDRRSDRGLRLAARGSSGDGGAFFIFCVEEGKGLQELSSGLTASSSGPILAVKHSEFRVWPLAAKYEFTT